MPMRDRLRATRAVWQLRKLDEADDRLDESSFGGWLAEHGQSQASIKSLWDLLIIAALNTDSDGASLLLATKVFQTALLRDPSAADIGIPLVPLADLHARAAQRTLETLGVKILSRTKVTGINSLNGTFETCTPDGAFAADTVVSAVPHRQVPALLPPDTVPRQDELGMLGSAPIVNAHLVFDRKVTDLPFVAVVDSPLQWIFDRTEISGARGNGQYLAVSLSAAGEFIDEPTNVLQAKLLPEVQQLFPAARDAQLTDFFVTRERHATFRQAPGTRQLRPGAATRIPGLLVAGAWTDTGWPDTMEGAVRSGNEAARLACQHLSCR
jgi:squalene-associated FAD-dependent desaturase